ncbi:DMT family transporter [uncultured Maritimibacter sp.]|uniref:DMT family transporter n=1 Tax=uncultured Maritimibacter sp. TaxID=991866 RepID=UPI000AD40CDE|nr:DMT family transporter [uncultured Maritimibacter sp.]
MTTTRPDRLGIGIGLKLCAVLAFVVMGALIKATAEAVPVGEVVFFRSLFAVPIMLGYLAYVGQLRDGIRTHRPIGHLWRGMVGTTAMALMFVSLTLLPLPEVTALQYATPIFIVILAAVMLGERIRLFRMAAVTMGLVGVIIVLWPRLSAIGGAPGGAAGGVLGGETLGAILMMGSALAAALAQVQVRSLVATERPATVALYFSLSSTFFSLLTAPFGWVWPEPWVVALLIICGLIGGAGQLCLSASYRFAPAATIAPFDYASIFFATAIGVVFFGEVPTVYTVVGASIVIAAGILIIWRERRLGKDRAASKQATQPPA